MSNQEGRTLAWNELAGTTGLGYNDAFIAFSDLRGWTGTFEDRMIQYLQVDLPSTKTTVPDLEVETAALLGLDSWNSVGYSIKTISP
jgi:hypothetical protein